MPSSARVIVIRGDLYSDTGYARATRALAALLARQALHVFGVSLHEHPNRKQNMFDFPVVSDNDVRAKAVCRDAVIVNICLPDTFIRVPGAVNVGYFFWETDRLPPGCFWKADMLKMDRLWAPSDWQRGILQTMTGRPDIPVVPWPLGEGLSLADAGAASLSAVRLHRAMTPGELDNHLVRSAPAGTQMMEKDLEAAEHARGSSSRFEPSQSSSYRQILERDGDLFIAVQTDAPRKGLPLLLATWLQFKASEAGRHAKLIIKLSSLDVSLDCLAAHFHASLAVHNACIRCRVAEPDIWFLYDRLSTGDMRLLLQDADAVVSATLGEGFGGPIAEALLEGTPVIAPRHTALQDIIDATYTLTVRSAPHHLKLWHNIDVYSDASLWHVVDDESFLTCFKTFALMSSEERRAVANTARVALLKRAGSESVEAVLRRELELCDGLVRHSTASEPTPQTIDALSPAPVVFEDVAL